MKQIEMFGNAKWIGAKKDSTDVSILIRRDFKSDKIRAAKLKLIGLGTFEVYINGKRVGDDYFLPLNSEYENINIPKGEELAYRIYATEYDVTSYLSNNRCLLKFLLTR